MRHQHRQKNKYELTFELYFDDKHGHFFNFLVRYFDKNLKCTTNKNTAAEWRLYTYEVANMLKIGNTDVIPRKDYKASLTYYEAKHLMYLEKLFCFSKNCIIHDSEHIQGRIYDQYFDSLEDMRNNFWTKLVTMKTSIQTDNQFIETIKDI